MIIAWLIAYLPFNYNLLYIMIIENKQTNKQTNKQIWCKKVLNTLFYSVARHSHLLKKS